MTKKQSTKKGGTKGKAEVTAERLRAFLASPDVKESAKAKVRKLVGELYEAGDNDQLPDVPEFYALEFEQTKYHRHAADGTLDDAEREIYAKLAAIINQHEPKDARLVDALSAVVADPKRKADRIAIVEAINNLSNHTYGVYDFHPEIFPVLARVIIREARQSEAGKGRGFVARSIRADIRQLEEIAGE